MTTPAEAPAAPCGLINLNKPVGMTSRGAVDRVARVLRRVKVGHAGTLDPLASGVLVVCVGSATRLIEYVQRQPKAYRTVVLLGARSDTLDADGTVTPVVGAVAPTFSAVEAAVATQVGTFPQRPPAFSALKVGGRRAYDLARSGEAVELAPRPVTVHAAEIRSYDWPRLELEIRCEGGTYVRSIARDIGEALGCGGLVEVLTRTAIGPFGLAGAVDPLSVTAETVLGHLRPSAEAVAALPGVRISAAQVADVALGRALDVPGVPAGELALIGPDGALAAVGEADPATGRVAPRRVLVAAGP